ncbi:MAG: DUF3025 domain-containing protein [Gammaproteobacteria bacterium]|jgi:hypothetical protein|nr:DUF3025 domain-containing protein [Gammaproteobacteria bacterium]
MGEPVARQVLRGSAVHQALQNAAASPGMSPAPVRFVPQAALLLGTAYEQFIFDTRTVPTRDNLHDFFNGLVWLQFPETKRRLNQLQAQAIAADGVQAVRGPLRDALTVFDENGAVLHAPPELWAALRARDWQRLFVDLRPLWQLARLVVVGHALLEKLVSPRKPMVAHVYQAHFAINMIADLDVWLAHDMEPQRWAGKPFVPLPVLGVPGWWPANEDPAFYADPEVFRAPRGAQVVATS